MQVLGSNMQITGSNKAGPGTDIFLTELMSEQQKSLIENLKPKSPILGCSFISQNTWFLVGFIFKERISQISECHTKKSFYILYWRIISDYLKTPILNFFWKLSNSLLDNSLRRRYKNFLDIHGQLSTLSMKIPGTLTLIPMGGGEGSYLPNRFCLAHLKIQLQLSWKMRWLYSQLYSRHPPNR